MPKKRKISDVEICRLCLRKVDTVNFKIIFGDEAQNISDKIFESTSIFVSPDDNLPQIICLNCEALLNIVTEFKATCLTANQLLVEGKNVFQEVKYWLCEDNKINLRRTEKLVSKNKKEMDDFHSIQEIKIEQEDEFEMIVKPELLVPEVATSEEMYEEPESEEKKLKKTQKAKKHYETPMVPCHVCGKMKKKRYMKYHLNVHNEIRPFACDKEGCKKAFYSPEGLRTHIKEVHSDEMKAICTTCGKRFKTKYYLKDHMLYHQEPVESTETCTVCGKLYRDKKAVREHMIWHREEKFQCEVCKKKFKVAKNLRIHMRIHTNEKPYPCDQCIMKFAYNCLLKTHKEKCH